jgi:hypothetical protein
MDRNALQRGVDLIQMSSILTTASMKTLLLQGTLVMFPATKENPFLSSEAGPTRKAVHNTVTLMDSLAFEHMDMRLESIGKPHPKTCQWLFTTEEHRMWRESETSYNGFLWIEKNIGAGNSTLMKCASHHDEEEFAGLRISFFFSPWGEGLQ